MRANRTLLLAFTVLVVAVAAGTTAYFAAGSRFTPAGGAGGQGDVASDAVEENENSNNPPVFEARTAAAEGWIVRPLNADDLLGGVRRRIDPRSVEGITAQDARAIAESAAEMFNLARHGTLADWQTREKRLGLATMIKTSNLSATDLLKRWEVDHHHMREAPLDLRNISVFLRANGGRGIEAPSDKSRRGGIETWRQYADGERYKPGDVNLAEYKGAIVEVAIPAEMQLFAGDGFIRGGMKIILAEREDGEWVPVRIGVYGIPNEKGMATPWI